MNSESRQRKRVVKPVVDVPIILQLQTVIGQEVHSKYAGVEYRYSVIHDYQPCVIYLPPEGRDAIVRAGPQPGDLVEFVMQRQGRQSWFQVQVLDDSQEPLPSRRIATNGQRTINDYQQKPRQAQPGTRQVSGSPARGFTNGAEPYNVYQIEELFVRCYEAAARAVRAGIEEAQSVGGPTDATFGDVSRTAISLFIDCRRNGTDD
jgi:hypothetical protein